MLPGSPQKREDRATPFGFGIGKFFGGIDILDHSRQASLGSDGFLIATLRAGGFMGWAASPQVEDIAGAVRTAWTMREALVGSVLLKV